MGKFATRDDDDGRTYDPTRFAGDEDDIEMLGNSRTRDALTDEERAENAEHDKLMEELRGELRGQDPVPKPED